MIFHDLVPLDLKVGDTAMSIITNSPMTVSKVNFRQMFCYKLKYISVTCYGLLDINYQMDVHKSGSDPWVYKSLLCNKLRRVIPI